MLDAPAGTFLYWPERQFLELIYGDLQAESAQVSVLGRLRGDVGWLRALGERVTRRQGHELIWAELTAGPMASSGGVAISPEHRGGAVTASSQAPADSGSTGPSSVSRADYLWDARFGALRQARVAAWQNEPRDIQRLVNRRGIMLPYGPLSMAEGEFRKLQELLWRLGTTLAKDIPAPERGRHAAFLIDAFLTRIVGLCGLHESGAILDQAAGLLRDYPDAAPAILEEVVLYSGRMAAWLDLYIPWHTLNEQVVNTRNKKGGHP